MPWTIDNNPLFCFFFLFMKQVKSYLNAPILVWTAVFKLIGQHNSLYGPAECQVDYRNSFTYMSSGVQWRRTLTLPEPSFLLASTCTQIIHDSAHKALCLCCKRVMKIQTIASFLEDWRTADTDGTRIVLRYTWRSYHHEDVTAPVMSAPAFQEYLTELSIPISIACYS